MNKDKSMSETTAILLIILSVIALLFTTLKLIKWADQVLERADKMLDKLTTSTEAQPKPKSKRRKS